MQNENKINGYPFREFESIGICSSKLYYLKSRTNSKRELNKKAFELKFGKGIDKEDTFLKHYKVQLHEISRNKLIDRAKKIRELREDFEKSAKYFNIKGNNNDRLWNIAMSFYYGLLNNS